MRWNAAGWVCVAVGSLCAVGALAGVGRAWELSFGEDWEVWVAQGEVGLTHIEKLNVMLVRPWPWDISIRPQEIRIQWWPSLQTGWPSGRSPYDRFIAIPPWMPMIACGTGAILCRRRARALAARAGTHCPCGYPTAGRPAGAPCPECGKKVHHRAAEGSTEDQDG
jgi:hypothetical protein